MISFKLRPQNIRLVAARRRTIAVIISNSIISRIWVAVAWVLWHLWHACFVICNSKTATAARLKAGLKIHPVAVPVCLAGSYRIARVFVVKNSSAVVICLRSIILLASRLLARALLKTAKVAAAKIPIIATTTKSSNKVNAAILLLKIFDIYILLNIKYYDFPFLISDFLSTNLCQALKQSKSNNQIF